MEEEIRVEEPKDQPVVEAIFEQVKEGHSVIGESVDKYSFKFSLKEVTNEHKGSQFLIEGEWFRRPIDFFLEDCEYNSHCHWTEILNKEYLIKI